MIEFLGVVLPVARVIILAIVVILGGVLALLSLYLLVLTLASFFPARKPARETQPMKRFAIMIPAHNEELLIGSLLASVRDLAYPSELYDVHVVADNCPDATADIVRGAGAQVHERHDRAAPGKANAINWLATRILAAPGTPPDAFVML